jgi:hypothetical protein
LPRGAPAQRQSQPFGLRLIAYRAVLFPCNGRTCRFGQTGSHFGCLCSGFNIDSLVVGRTNTSELSRMTIVVIGSAAQKDQIIKQLASMVRSSGLGLCDGTA